MNETKEIMMKTMRLIVSLILVICFIAFPGCRKKASEEVDFGTVEDSVYQNKYFGMSVTFPHDWNVLDRKSMEMLMNVGKKIAAGSNKNLQAAMEASEMQTVSLFAVSKHPIGTPVPFNPIIMCAAERIRNLPGVKKGRDYLYHAKKMVTASRINVKYPEAIYTETIDNVDFDVLTSEMSMGRMVIKQKQYATVRKGYALLFVLSFTTNESEESLESIMDTVTFAF